MSKGYINGAYALGLTTGIGVVLNLFLWLDYHAKNKCINDPERCQPQDNNYVGNTWDGIIGTFVSPNDSLAQWIMASFTICATIVLILTLRSANKTNLAAIKASEAAQEANQIMRDEQRPWLQFEVEDFGLKHAHSGDGKAHPFFVPKINVTNHGKRPAFWVTLDIRVMISDSFSISAIDTLLEERRQQNSITFSEVVFPGGHLLLEKMGTKIYEPGIDLTGGGIVQNTFSLLVVLLYSEGEETRYTAKFYNGRATELLPNANAKKFTPAHLSAFDRYI